MISYFGVDGAHGFHVRFPPLSSEILGLHLQQLQHVQLQHSVLHLQSPLEYRGRLEHDQHLKGQRNSEILSESETDHDPGVFPLGELVKDPEEVDAAGHVAPAEHRGVPHLQRLRGQLRLLADDAAGVVQQRDVVLAADVSHDVLVKEFQHQGNAVRENKMLGHEFKLVNVIDLEML